MLHSNYRKRLLVIYAYMTYAYATLPLILTNVRSKFILTKTNKIND